MSPVMFRSSVGLEPHWLRFRVCIERHDSRERRNECVKLSVVNVSLIGLNSLIVTDVDFSVYYRAKQKKAVFNLSTI